jgi:hypothetical protein
MKVFGTNKAVERTGISHGGLSMDDSAVPSHCVPVAHFDRSATLNVYAIVA